MRHVVKNIADRVLHLADAPYTRSYCTKLRGALVLVDPDRASERIADRTVAVCTACRTVLDDRRAAAHVTADDFMITADEARPAVRPAVEPGLFDLGDAETPPAPGARAVASAVPAVGRACSARSTPRSRRRSCRGTGSCRWSVSALSSRLGCPRSAPTGRRRARFKPPRGVTGKNLN